MRVFLSYSTRDRRVIERLAADLAHRGIDVWLDAYEIRVGDVIVEKIGIGLEQADYVLVWLTKNAIASKWVQREWWAKFHDEIMDGRVRVLPLLAEDCDVPIFLRSKRYADFRVDYAHGLRELLDSFGLTDFIDATIAVDLNGPVRWAFFGYSLSIAVSASNMPEGYKLALFVRNLGEDCDVWHFQFERALTLVNERVSGRVWFGTRRQGDQEDYEVLVAIVTAQRRFRRHPATVSLDYREFQRYEIFTVHRDDSQSKGIR